MQEAFARTAMLIGEAGVACLQRSRVLVFGVGGVGGGCVEALARAGVGRIGLVDNDTVAESNLNRQLIALHTTLGTPKVEAAAARIHAICPQTQVDLYPIFYLPENADAIDLSQYDYIIDAIDTVSAKLALIERAKALNVPIISCMGTGNKFDPTRFVISDITKTSVCPLARVMRRELKKRGIAHLDVLWSDEEPRTPPAEEGKKPTPGSISFVPPVAGMMIGGHVILKLLEKAGLSPR